MPAFTFCWRPLSSLFTPYKWTPIEGLPVFTLNNTFHAQSRLGLHSATPLCSIQCKHVTTLPLSTLHVFNQSAISTECCLLQNTDKRSQSNRRLFCKYVSPATDNFDSRLDIIYYTTVDRVHTIVVFKCFVD